MADLITTLQNYKITCEGRAREQERLAADIRSGSKSGNDALDAADEAKAKIHDRNAQRWKVRADYAGRGLMAKHIDNGEGLRHQWEYGRLHDAAAADFRFVELD
jgi:hypothetical protein